jgi:hypothetical protein
MPYRSNWRKIYHVDGTSSQVNQLTGEVLHSSGSTYSHLNQSIDTMKYEDDYSMAKEMEDDDYRFLRSGKNSYSDAFYNSDYKKPYRSPFIDHPSWAKGWSGWEVTTHHGDKCVTTTHGNQTFIIHGCGLIYIQDGRFPSKRREGTTILLDTPDAAKRVAEQIILGCNILPGDLDDDCDDDNDDDELLSAFDSDYFKFDPAVDVHYNSDGTVTIFGQDYNELFDSKGDVYFKNCCTGEVIDMYGRYGRIPEI